MDSYLENFGYCAVVVDLSNFLLSNFLLYNFVMPVWFVGNLDGSLSVAH